MIEIKLLSSKSDKAQINIQTSIEARLIAFAEMEDISLVDALHRALDFAIEYSQLRSEILKYNERNSNESSSSSSNRPNIIYGV